jgi:glycosyltransferase involved in cell wall biosynthesis
LDTILLVHRKHPSSSIYTEMLGGVKVQTVSQGLLALLGRITDIPAYVLTPRHRGKETIVDIPSLLLHPLTLRNEDFDALLCHDQLSGIYGLLAKRVKGIPFAVYAYQALTGDIDRLRVHGLAPGISSAFRVSDVFRRLEKTVLLSADIVISLSQFTARQILNAYGITSEVVYPGCDPPKEIPPRRGNFILAASRWDPGKNAETLVEIAKGIPGAQIVMAGSWFPPEYRLHFEQHLRDAGINDRFRVLGTVSEQDLKKYYLSARAYVHPNAEPFGMNILEAAAHGCPIVVPRKAGAAELFEENVHGFFTDTVIYHQAKAEDYIPPLKTLLEDERLAWRMGHAAWQTSKQHDWKDHAKRLVEVLPFSDSSGPRK